MLTGVRETKCYKIGEWKEDGGYQSVFLKAGKPKERPLTKKKNKQTKGEMEFLTGYLILFSNLS